MTGRSCGASLSFFRDGIKTAVGHTRTSYGYHQCGLSGHNSGKRSSCEILDIVYDKHILVSNIVEDVGKHEGII